MINFCPQCGKEQYERSNYCPQCGCNLQDLIGNSQERKFGPVRGSDETVVSPDGNEHLQQTISCEDLEYYSEIEKALASIGKSKPNAIKMEDEFTYLVLDSENVPYIVEVGGFRPSIRETSHEEYEKAKQLPPVSSKRAGGEDQRAGKKNRMKLANIVANILFFCAFMILREANVQDFELGSRIPGIFPFLVYCSFAFSLLCFYLKPHISILITLATPIFNYGFAKELYEATVYWVSQNANPGLAEEIAEVQKMFFDLTIYLPLITLAVIGFKYYQVRKGKQKEEQRATFFGRT